MQARHHEGSPLLAVRTVYRRAIHHRVERPPRAPTTTVRLPFPLHSAYHSTPPDAPIYYFALPRIVHLATPSCRLTLASVHRYIKHGIAPIVRPAFDVVRTHAASTFDCERGTRHRPPRTSVLHPHTRLLTPVYTTPRTHASGVDTRAAQTELATTLILVNSLCCGQTVRGGAEAGSELIRVCVHVGQRRALCTFVYRGISNEQECSNGN